MSAHTRLVLIHPYKHQSGCHSTHAVVRTDKIVELTADVAATSILRSPPELFSPIDEMYIFDPSAARKVAEANPCVPFVEDMVGCVTWSDSDYWRTLSAGSSNPTSESGLSRCRPVVFAAWKINDEASPRRLHVSGYIKSKEFGPLEFGWRSWTISRLAAVIQATVDGCMGPYSIDYPVLDIGVFKTNPGGEAFHLAGEPSTGRRISLGKTATKAAIDLRFYGFDTSWDKEAASWIKRSIEHALDQASAAVVTRAAQLAKMAYSLKYDQ